jgi:hypothetical protein
MDSLEGLFLMIDRLEFKEDAAKVNMWCLKLSQLVFNAVELES